MTFRVTDATWLDISRAIQFYNSKPGQYGLAFRREVERALKKIRKSPRQLAPVEDAYPGFETREYLIDRFDQRVIFTVDSSVIEVVAVVHASRRPGSWHKRLEFQ